MKTIFTLLLALAIIIPATAQIYSSEDIKDKTTDATEQKVNREIDNTIDQGVDKGFKSLKNAIFGKKKKKKNKDADNTDGNDANTQEDYMKIMGMEMVEVDGPFVFDITADILVTTTDEKGKTEDFDYVMLFPKDGNFFAMEINDQGQTNGQTNAIIIFDYGNKQMITMTHSDGEKVGMVMPIKDDISSGVDTDSKENEQTEDFSFKKANQTKTILGYKCDLYMFESEDGNGEFWVTQDENMQIGFAMHAMRMNKQESYKLPDNYPEGAIMEMNFLDTDGSKVNWETTNIDSKTQKTVKTEGYQFMSLDGMPGMGK